MKTISIAMLTLAAVGCADDRDCPIALGEQSCGNETVRSCYQRTPSFETGVYGCVVMLNDSDLAMLGRPAIIQVAVHGSTTGATFQTDATGYYEIELPPGAHEFCATNQRCFTVTVTALTRTGFDASIAPIIQWWLRDDA